MKKLFVLTIVCIAVFMSSFNIHAQLSEIHENNTWYLDKQAAINAALSQNKQLFVCWGRATCGYTTNVRQLLGTEKLKPLVDKDYVLWYVDGDIFSLLGPATYEYFYDTIRYMSTITLPVICLVDKYDIHHSFGFTTGPKNESELIAMLLYDVANEKVTTITPDVKVYFSGKELTVNGGNTNESVSVYSITGSLVDKFNKTEEYIIRDASSYPTGILIVAGSSGWARKVINKK